MRKSYKTHTRCTRCEKWYPDLKLIFCPECGNFVRHSSRYKYTAASKQKNPNKLTPEQKAHNKFNRILVKIQNGQVEPTYLRQKEKAEKGLIQSYRPEEDFDNRI